MNVDFENYLDTCIGPLNAGIRWLGDPFSTVNQGSVSVLNNSIYAFTGNRCGWIYTGSADQMARIRLQRRYNAPSPTGDTVVEFMFRPQRSGDITFGSMLVWSSNSYDGGPVALTLIGRGVAGSGVYTLDIQDGTGTIANAVTGLPQNQWQRFILHRKKSAGTVDLWVGAPGLETLRGTYRDLNAGTNVGRAELGDTSESSITGSGYWDDIRVGEVLAGGGQVFPPESRPVIGQEPPAIQYPITVTSERQLFVDDMVIQSMTGLTRTLHPVQKYTGNPIMVPDQPWEVSALCLLPLPTIYYIPQVNKYRVWYGIWGAQINLPTYEGLAESVDGLIWTKPNLGLFSYNGSTANNILREGRMFRVNYDPVDANSAKRYKAIIRDNGFLASFSADGLRWTAERQVLDQAYDATCVNWDPVGQKWIASCKIFLNDKRCRGYAESYDYLNWTDTSFMLTVDSRDDPSDQIYSMTFFRYESAYIGLPKLYHVASDRCDIQLAFSRDTQYWQRPDRTAFIPNGANVADWDYGNLDDDGEPLRMGDELWFYYAGRKELHNQMPQHGGMGMGRLRVDGFRSVDAGDAEGTLTTPPLLLKGKSLYVNAEATGGEVRVEMLEGGSDTPILPFAKANCQIIGGSGVRQVVQWNGESSFTWPDRPVRLRFSLRRAKVYSFWTEGYLRAVVQGVVRPDGYTGDLQNVGVKLELFENGQSIRQERVFLEADGRFALGDVESGVYELSISSYAHLRKLVPVEVVANPTDLGTIHLSAGDTDGDNEITSADLSVVLTNTNKIGGP